MYLPRELIMVCANFLTSMGVMLVTLRIIIIENVFYEHNRRRSLHYGIEHNSIDRLNYLSSSETKMCGC